jgi:hypothetical protein
VCIVKRVLAILALVGVLSAGGAALLWRSAGGVGGSNVEQWVGNQLVGVLANYITPTIRFKTLDYQAPYTVVVSDLTIDHDDTAMVRLEQLRLELAEVPRRGEPIQIKEIVATRPRLLFRHAARGFVGWSGFVKPQAVTNPETIPEGQRFSDVLVLRRVQISDGVLVYEERGRGDTRMTLPGVNLTLATPPVDGQDGLYALNCEVKRNNLFDARIDAQLNVDTQLLTVTELIAKISLDETGRGALPPALQRLMERYQARGVLTARIAGEIPLASLDQATASVQAELADANIALGQTAVPIGKVVIDGDFPNGPLKLETGRVALNHQGEAILGFDRFALTLAGLPRENRLWTISSLQLDRPTIALLRTDGGDWFGWSDIARGLARAPQASSNAPSAPSPSPGARTDGYDMSRVAIEDAQVTDAAVRWRRDPTVDPMILDKIDLAFSGSIPLASPLTANGEGSLAVRQASIHLASKVLPIEALDTRVSLEHGEARIDCTGRVLSGHIRVMGSVLLQAARTFELQWEVTDLALAETQPMQDRAGLATKQTLAGRLATQGTATGTWTHLPDSLTGAGTLAVRDGRLFGVPIISQITDLLSAIPVGRALIPGDTVDLEFDLQGEGVRINRSKIVTSLALIRGTGLIGYDGTLDLLVSAGPMEKIKDKLGKVGDLLKDLGDRLAQYSVKGTIDKPKVGVRALGTGK